MDKLPVELLRAISDFIESDPSIFDAQKDLAVLSRVNKTFYTICHERLYLEPALGNPRMVKKWIRTYSSLINPWSICAGTRHLKDVIVPEAIIFEVYKTQIEQMEDEELSDFNCERYSVDQLLPPLNDFAVSMSFFRNVTSITVSYRFPLPDDFIVALCGPLGTNRNILQEFSVEEDNGCWFPSFLFEACSRMVWEWMDLDYLAVYGLIAELRHCDPLCQSIHERKEEMQEEEDNYYISDEEYDQLIELAPRYAPSNYQVSCYLFPETYSSRDVLRSILKTRNIPCHPFEALRSLTSFVSMTYELYLILHSRLFPVLRDLKLIGYFGSPDTIACDVKLIRYSITKQVVLLLDIVSRREGLTTTSFNRRQGEIWEPDVDDSVLAAHPKLFDSWAPLTKDEMESEPEIDYFGPNLDELNLSECQIIPQE